jgi:hypothetical protein
MRNEVKNRAVGPLRSPRRAPVVGVGADFKTTASWGGRSCPLGPNDDAVPSGLAVGRFKRRTAYRTTNFDVVVRLVAVLLHRVAVSSRGSVVYVNGRKLARYLGLSGVVHPIDLSAIYSLMEKLGFEVVRTSRGVTAVISMDKPVMKEVKAAKSIDEVIMTVKKYLSG